MNKILSVLAIATSLLACNGATKDPVEKADSANAAHRNAVPKEQLPADKQTAGFLVDAAEASLTQSQLSELAFQKGLNQPLKNYGSQMMRDHGMMNEAIKALATGLQVTIPSELGENNQKELEKLKAKDTKDFDKDLTNALIREHEKEIDLYSKGSANVNNADVKIFIDNGLPKLRQHLDSLKLIQKMLK